MSSYPKRIYAEILRTYLFYDPLNPEFFVLFNDASLSLIVCLPSVQLISSPNDRFSVNLKCGHISNSFQFRNNKYKENKYKTAILFQLVAMILVWFLRDLKQISSRPIERILRNYKLQLPMSISMAITYEAAFLERWWLIHLVWFLKD